MSKICDICGGSSPDEASSAESVENKISVILMQKII